MKKRILLLIMILSVFTLVGCGSGEKNDSNGKKNIINSNQKGYVEGKYFIKDLTFNLPDGYEPNGENRYSLLDGENGIMVELYVNENFEGTIDDYVKKDENMFYPNEQSLETIEINGNNWLKGETKDNGTIYYIRQGKEIYSIMLSPLFTKAGVFNTLIETFENSLYFKQ